VSVLILFVSIGKSVSTSKTVMIVATYVEGLFPNRKHLRGSIPRPEGAIELMRSVYLALMFCCFDECFVYYILDKFLFLFWNLDASVPSPDQRLQYSWFLSAFTSTLLSASKPRLSTRGEKVNQDMALRRHPFDNQTPSPLSSMNASLCCSRKL
jgi:hypothetical protein